MHLMSKFYSDLEPMWGQHRDSEAPSALPSKLIICLQSNQLSPSFSNVFSNVQCFLSKIYGLKHQVLNLRKLKTFFFSNLWGLENIFCYSKIGSNQSSYLSKAKCCFSEIKLNRIPDKRLIQCLGRLW